MHINLNNSLKEITSGTSIETLLEIIKQPVNGIAIAVNSAVVPKSAWNNTLLNENDNVLVVQATQGG